MKISQNDVQTAIMTVEQLQNEFDYMVAQQMLNDMHSKGLITVDELHKIEALNLENLSPELTSIMSTNH